MKQTSRSKRLAELIQRSVASNLLYYKEHPLLALVTITDVEVAVDLSIARIFISVFDDSQIEDVLRALHREGGHLRHALAKELNLRITPRLTFVHDKSILEGEKISKLINSAL